MDAATVLAALAAVLPPGVDGTLTEILAGAFILSGAVAQIAALFGLDGVAKVSTTLHTVLQGVAGNYGKAANGQTEGSEPRLPPGAIAA